MRKPDTYTRWMALADDTEAEVSFDVHDYGSAPSGVYNCPPEHYDPGCGPELYVTGGVDEDGRPVVLDDVEVERLTDAILDNPDWWTPEPDYYD